MPVYFGASNAKDHIPFDGVIFVDDFPSIPALASYLTKVSNDQKLYESYHSWRERPLPEKFLNKYNISNTHSKCRTCRWGFARKYGLGWNHASQSVEPTILQRKTCVQANYLTSPAIESWRMTDSSNNRSELVLHNFAALESSCPLVQNFIPRARVGNSSLMRSIWSNDGATDIYIEGEIPHSYILRLTFPMKQHETLWIDKPNLNLLWIQDNKSRVSLAFNVNPESQKDIKDIVFVSSGVFEIRIDPDLPLPLRVRIVVENLDTFHKGGSTQLSYYGLRVSEDIMKPPQLFLAGDINPFKSEDSQVSSIHMKVRKVN